jgi:phage terminase small subunit
VVDSGFLELHKALLILNNLKGNNMPRSRKPKKLHLLQNTYRKDRHGDRDELELPPGVPEKPGFLNETAAAEWDKIAEKLSDYGILSDLDEAALAVYCELYSEFQSTRSCPSKFPAAKIAAFRASYADLGLSPISRIKISSRAKKEKKKNPFAPPGKNQ